MSSEKRSFARVKTVVPCRFRRVGPDDGLTSLGAFAPASPVDVAGIKASALPEAVQTFLFNLDAKLDMLLAMASQQQQHKDFPVSGRVIDISGSGLRFACDAEFAIGENVEVIITLSGAPLQQAGALGRIIRREPVGDKVLWIMEFTKIRERDQELIVQFVFQEQRAQIREKKWS